MVALTLPLVRALRRRIGAISTSVVASAVQGTTIVLFGGARAAEVTHDHQGMLNLVVGTPGPAGFLIGVLLVAGLLGPLGFGVVIALIGVGTATTALAFHRSLVAT